MLNREQIEYLYRGIQEEVIEGIKLTALDKFATCEAMREYTIALTENNPEDFHIWEKVCENYANYWKTYFEDSPEAADKALQERYAASKEYSAKQAKLLTEQLMAKMAENKTE